MVLYGKDYPQELSLFLSLPHSLSLSLSLSMRDNIFLQNDFNSTTNSSRAVLAVYGTEVIDDEYCTLSLMNGLYLIKIKSTEKCATRSNSFGPRFLYIDWHLRAKVYQLYRLKYSQLFFNFSALALYASYPWLTTLSFFHSSCNENVYLLSQFHSSQKNCFPPPAWWRILLSSW